MALGSVCSTYPKMPDLIVQFGVLDIPQIADAQWLNQLRNFGHLGILESSLNGIILKERRYELGGDPR